jgi:hypothetical protein
MVKIQLSELSPVGLLNQSSTPFPMGSAATRVPFGFTNDVMGNTLQAIRVNVNPLSENL